MISSNEYKMLSKVLKQAKKGKAIDISKIENIKFFPYITVHVEEFTNVQHPLWAALNYEGLTKYFKDIYSTNFITLNSEGLSAYEEYRRARTTRLKSWTSLILSILAIIISIIALTV